MHVLALDLLVDHVGSGRRMTGRGWTVAGLVLAVPFVPVLVPLAVGRAGWLARARGAAPSAWLRHPAWAWIVRAGLAVLFALAVVSIVDDVLTLS